MAKRKAKAEPSACGFDGSPLESDYYCRRRKAEVAEDEACWNCLDMPMSEWQEPAMETIEALRKARKYLDHIAIEDHVHVGSGESWTDAYTRTEREVRAEVAAIDEVMSSVNRG